MQEEGYKTNPYACPACGDNIHSIPSNRLPGMTLWKCNASNCGLEFVFNQATPVVEDNDTTDITITNEDLEVLIRALADSALRYEVEAEDYQSKSDAAMDTRRDIEVLKRKLEGM